MPTVKELIQQLPPPIVVSEEERAAHQAAYQAWFTGRLIELTGCTPERAAELEAKYHSPILTCLEHGATLDEIEGLTFYQMALLSGRLAMQRFKQVTTS